MNSRRTKIVFAATYLVCASAVAAQKTPTEAQCRSMVDGMVQAMKSAPLEKERDKQGARVVIERVEKVVKENRARGVSECESWAAVSKIITTQ